MPDVPAPFPARLRPARRAGLLAGDLLIGAGAALGQAPWNLWPLTVLALTAMLWRVGAAPSARAALWRGLTIGTGHFALALAWITQPFLVEPELYGWMSPFALILMGLGGGLFWAIPGWISHHLGHDRRTRGLALALLIVLSDWLRGWIFTGLPWALTGHVWIATPAGQIAAWGGALILSALTMAAAALPVWATRAPSGWTQISPPEAPTAPHRTTRQLTRGATLSAMLIAAAWIAGLARLAQPLPPDHAQIVRLVQPDADQTLKWDPNWGPVFYDRLLALSALPLKPELSPADTRPSVVVWPETAAPFLLNDATPILSQIAAASGDTTLIGIQRGDENGWFNSLAEITPDATIGAVYDKFHLVPFGEYIPWGETLARFGITAFAARQGHGYAAGDGPVVLDLPGLPPVQPMICYETIFERDLARHETRPDWLLQVTNDAWFGTWSGPYQHLAQARLRAIQSGLPLMRAANTGVSAVIDARGHVRDTLPLGVAGVLDARLPGGLPATLWWRLGDAPMLVLLAALLGLTLREKRRAF